MPRTMRCLFLMIFLFISYYTSGIPGEGIAYAESLASPAIANKLQELSPEQRIAVEAEINKTGGILTPETINSLKERQEFKDIAPVDIANGRDVLEEKGSEGKEEAPEETGGPVIKDNGRRSLFDRYRSVGPYQGISTDLKPFGYKFFSRAVAKPLAPRKDIPVSPDYIIGPGDEVKMLFWGRVNAQYSLVVNKDGEITIPRIGPLQVAGMRFDEMRNYLTDQANKIIGAKINVTLGMMKSIQVFVLGEARSPGSYALGSFSTITNAILASGGPTEIGSLRNIQLKRNDKAIVVMDFYDFLLKGDKTQDSILQSGDVIFIPTTGPLVGIAGNVKRPAIYELKNGYDLMNLFNMAGGVTPGAYTQQIQV
ncbi:MAG TPA: hypothetical protein ENH01_09080, partial [Nitrospirae bacterium]|nr:hypothetical protein [Nitrospirota bacterium]